MIQVEGMSIAYHGHFLFENVSFTIQSGERCGLVGRNGAGKSTLLRLMTGEEKPDSGTIAMRKGYTIATLKQHIAFSQPTILLEALIDLPEEIRHESHRAEKVLFGLGFKESDLSASPHSFSGGYQLRLHLAKALLLEPQCLLLDEPTNFLDIVSIRWLTALLQQWKGEFIIISHDREFMDSVTTHTMGIHRQKVRKAKGSTIDLFDQICAEEEIHQRTLQNQEKKRAHLQSFIDRFGAKATKAAQARSRQKMLQRIPVLEKLKEMYQLDFLFREAVFNGKMMLSTNGLAFGYHGGPTLVKDFSLSIEKGEKIAIVGKNGRGKSTLLRLMAQELLPQEGEVRLSPNVKIGYFGQANIERLHRHNTIAQEISAANPTLAQSEIKAVCGVMMFSGDLSEKPIDVLSGGERSRVLLGKIVATPCNLLLLDEPTHHLDMESIEALIDALEEFEGAMILVTHSELMLKRIPFDKIILCSEGSQELFLGDYETFLEKGGWQYDISASALKKPSKGSKELKQQRAALITARSRELKPIDTAIAKAEAEVAKLEGEQEAAHMIMASNPVGVNMQELTKTSAQRQKAVNALYDKLEELLSQRDAIMQNYQKFT